MNGHDVAEKVASSALFTIVGRAVMILTPIIVVPLLGWVGQSLIALNTKVEVLGNTVSFAMTDRYRADDARRDFQLRDLRIETLTMRLSDLEHEVRANKIDIKQQQQKIEQVVPKRAR